MHEKNFTFHIHLALRPPLDIHLPPQLKNPKTTTATNKTGHWISFWQGVMKQLQLIDEEHQTGCLVLNSSSLNV